MTSQAFKANYGAIDWSHPLPADPPRVAHPCKRSSLPAPSVIRDDLGPNGLLNHADGRVYTSKRAYLAGVKAAGCEVVGDERIKVEPPTRQKDPSLRREIAEQVKLTLRKGRRRGR